MNHSALRPHTLVAEGLVSVILSSFHQFALHAGVKFTCTSSFRPVHSGYTQFEWWMAAWHNSSGCISGYICTLSPKSWYRLFSASISGYIQVSKPLPRHTFNMRHTAYEGVKCHMKREAAMLWQVLRVQSRVRVAHSPAAAVIPALIETCSS